MTTGAALGASGLSFALGIMNSRNLNSLTEEVEKMKLTMVASETVDPAIEQDLLTLETPSDLNRKAITAVDNRVQTLEKGASTLAQTSKSVEELGSSFKTLNSKVVEMDLDIQNTLFDVETVVNLRPDIEDIVKNWKHFSTNAHVSGSGVFNASKCKLGLMSNKGTESAIHFAGVANPDWSMYAANPNGKTTVGKAPPSHGGVTGYATRMRIGNNVNDGFIVENSSNGGVFSVGSDGKTTMGSMVNGDLSTDTIGVAYLQNHNLTNFALSQKKDGTTRINSSSGKNIQLGINGGTKVVVEGHSARTLTLKNGAGVGDTHFNWDGNNYIRCADGKSTMFRSGLHATNQLAINKNGTYVKGLLSVDGVNANYAIKNFASLEASVKALEVRVKTIETNYIDTRNNRIGLYNQNAKKYISSDGNVSTSKTSSHARYSLVKL